MHLQILLCHRGNEERYSLKITRGIKKRGKGLEAVSGALLSWRELQAKHGIIAFGAWIPEKLDKARTVAGALHTFAGLCSQDKESYNRGRVRRSERESCTQLYVI